MRTLLITLLAAPFIVPQPIRAESNLPGEVNAYVTRLRECNHWGGEDAYDPARARAIAAAAKALRCDAVEADERRLRQRFGRDPAVLRALDRARDADG